MSRFLVRTIILDIGNVLLDFDHSITWRGIAGEAGVGWSEVREFLVDGGLSRNFDRGRISPDELFALTRERFALETSADEFFGLWADIFTPREEVLALLPSLADRFPLYLLSNTDPVHFAHIEKTYAFPKFFRGRVLSFEVGFRKPDPGIFREAIRMAGFPPGECLFFDDIHDHVLAARRMGMLAHLFDGIHGMVEVLRGYGIEAK